MSRRGRRDNRLALVALALWVPVAAGLVWLGLRGTQRGAVDAAALSPAADGRQAIVVSPADALVVSQVMRDNLSGLQAIQQAAAEGNMAAVSRAAESWAATPGPARQSATLEQKLPRQWRALGFSLHETLRQLADDAGRPDFSAELLSVRLSEGVGACVACHASYRLVVLPEDAAADP